MKLQTMFVVVVGCAIGLAFTASLGIMAVWQLTAPVGERPLAAWNGGLPEAEPFAFQEPAARQCTNAELQALRGPMVATRDYRISGPFTHANLSVYLVHGQDMLKNRRVLTLQEALDQNLAVVHDTGRGNLTLDNRADVPLLIQAGDIVKGGIQDRVLPYDLLTPPQAERQPLAALCVEQGRSGPRGNELSASFSSATERLPTKGLRLAAYRQAQEEVWNEVRLLQTKLTRNAGGPVMGNLSPTSLQLTMENHRVEQGIGDYLQKIALAPQGQEDVIGFVVALNGRVQSADVYASSELFDKLWFRLLRASAIEALAEQDRGAAVAPPTADAVKAFLADAETGQASQQQYGRQTLVLRQEGRSSVLHDTCDAAAGNLVLHRSVLAK